MACGVQAVINLKGLTKNDLRHFTQMMKKLETRGTDATGLADQHLNMIKRPIRSSQFVKTRLYKKFVHRTLGQKWIIGHARRTTRGDAKINTNNHPISTMGGKYWLVHNGVVRSTTIQNPIHISDTHIIAKAITKHWKEGDLLTTIKKAYTEFSGVATIIVTTKRQIGFARYTHPLNVGMLPSMAYAIASTPEILQVNRIPRQISEVKNQHVVVIDTKGIVTKAELKMQEVKIEPVHYTQYDRHLQPFPEPRYSPTARTGIISYDQYGNPIYARGMSWIERQENIARRNKHTSLREVEWDTDRIVRKPVQVTHHKRGRTIVTAHRRQRPRRKYRW